MEDLMDRQKLVGWLVRDRITASGKSYTDAARRWPMALPTLNRLMNTGNVGLRFYRVAEKNLGLPENLLDAIVNGDAATIRTMAGLDPKIRDFILTELGEPVSRSRRKTS